MAATPENPIIFYDIASNDGSWSPNTYKTRLTLNFKRLPYRIEYVPMANIEAKLKELGIPPSPSNPFFKYTLPMIVDPSSDPTKPPTYVVESFQIALYLDEKYPAPKHPLVIPPGTQALQKIAIDHVGNLSILLAPFILAHAALRPGFLNEPDFEYFNRTRSAIVGMDLPKLLDSADQHWAVAKKKWDALGTSLGTTSKEGPFVMGGQISFTDFAIGGVFHALQRAEGGELSVWKRVATWQGGKWAAFWEEIVKLEANSSEVAA